MHEGKEVFMHETSLPVVRSNIMLIKHLLFGKFLVEFPHSLRASEIG